MTKVHTLGAIEQTHTREEIRDGPQSIHALQVLVPRPRLVTVHTAKELDIGNSALAPHNTLYFRRTFLGLTVGPHRRNTRMRQYMLLVRRNIK